MVWVGAFSPWMFAKAQGNISALDTDDDLSLYHLFAQITLNQRRELEQIFPLYIFPHIHFVEKEFLWRVKFASCWL